MRSPPPQQEQLQQTREALGLVADHPQVKAWLHEADEQLLTRGSREPGVRQRLRHFAWAAAAALVTIAAAVLLAYPRFATQHYETRVGEQRDVLLPDGSRITLNTNTLVSVRYTRQRRYLVLERGEALFAVAHNPSRPFEVAASDTLTRALGTEFNVDMRGSAITVSVLEGVVRVSTPDATAGSGTGGGAATTTEALAKGEALEFRPQERLLLQHRADLGRIDAWRTRRLEFSNTPLAEAVAEFNRYSSTQLVIGTRDLAQVRVSGVFRIGDTDGFLYSLREALGVESHDAANEVVLIRPQT